MRSAPWWCLALLALLAHGGSLANGFVYDDHRFIVENPALDGLGWRDALLEPATHTADDDRDVYRPLRALSHAFDLTRWGRDAFGFHLHSVALHVACVLLAAAALRRLLPAAWAPAGFAGAALLAVHPVGVEAVGWVSSRGDQQAVAFGFVALLAASAPWRVVGPALAATAACAATLGKESAAVLPAVGALHLLARRRAWGTAAPDDAAPRVGGPAVGALAAGVVVALVLRQVALSGADPSQTPPHGGSHLAQVGWALFGIGRAALHLAWPADLAVRYPSQAWAAVGSPWLQAPGLLGALLVAGALLSTARLARRAPLPPRAAWGGFLVGWAALAYLPSSSLLVTLRELVNDRALLPCLAPLGAALALPFCGRRLARPAALAGLALCVALLPLSWARVAAFRSDTSLWRDVLEQQPHSPGAHLGLAHAALGAGRVDEALALLERGAALAPAGTKARAELLAFRGDALLRRRGAGPETLAVLREALDAVRAWDAREHPSMVGDATAASLAEALVRAGRPDEGLALLDAERERAARPEQLVLKRALLLRALAADDAARWGATYAETLERVARLLPDHPLVEAMRAEGAAP